MEKSDYKFHNFTKFQAINLFMKEVSVIFLKEIEPVLDFYKFIVIVIVYREPGCQWSLASNQYIRRTISIKQDFMWKCSKYWYSFFFWKYMISLNSYTINTFKKSISAKK